MRGGDYRDRLQKQVLVGVRDCPTIGGQSRPIPNGRNQPLVPSGTVLGHSLARQWLSPRKMLSAGSFSTSGRERPKARIGGEKRRDAGCRGRGAGPSGAVFVHSSGQSRMPAQPPQLRLSAEWAMARVRQRCGRDEFETYDWWRECCCHRNFSPSDGLRSSRTATVPYELQASKLSRPTGGRIEGVLSSPLTRLLCCRNRPNRPNGPNGVQDAP